MIFVKNVQCSILVIMKRVGDVFSVIFDERMMEKAEGFSKLFSFWAEATKKNGIPAAADHSRIKDLDRGILLIEADHPGWKQIIQTKQSRILNYFRYNFPDLDISGISIMLSRDSPDNKKVSVDIDAGTAIPANLALKTDAIKTNLPKEQSEEEGYEDIKDKGLKEILQRLERSLTS